jgi:hypothetical protein
VLTEIDEKRRESLTIGSDMITGLGKLTQKITLKGINNRESLPYYSRKKIIYFSLWRRLSLRPDRTRFIYYQETSSKQKRL